MMRLGFLLSPPIAGLLVVVLSQVLSGRIRQQPTPLAGGH
jgi:predicted PurR-regulated permease PerM